MPINAEYRGPADLPKIIPVFPLPGALLLPRGQMPLNIFEPRYLQMLRNAHKALDMVPIIKARGPRVRQDEKPWDPDQLIRPDPVQAWRPFFGHGLPIVEPRCVQLFHYPPLRLLQKYRDYLDDPVPRKVEILLVANQSFDDLLAQSDKPASELQNKPPYRLALYERVIDSCPVAAPDDQGSKPVVDAQGKPISRRVHQMSDLYLPLRTLKAGSELPIQASLGIGDRPVSGYTVEIFYP